MNNDQWFEPGDKVMLVEKVVLSNKGVKPPNGAPVFGRVYCVEDFYEGPQFNAVMLTGFGGWLYDPYGRPIGWPAIAFRKVSEIKLCVAALKPQEVKREHVEPFPPPVPSESVKAFVAFLNQQPFK